MNPSDYLPLNQAKHPLFLGVDVGGNSIKIGLVDDAGHPLAFTTFDTLEERGCEDAVQRIAAHSREMLARIGLTLRDVEAVGLGTPGTMDIPAGLVLDPPNLPHWRHFPIRDRLAAVTDRRVAFANDANAAAYGEFWVGRGREYHSIVLLTLGTGVGGGIIIGDVSIDGEHSHGSECGHITIDTSADVRRCSCGRLGHLEAYASATALIHRTADALASGRKSSLQGAVATGEKLSGLLIAQHAEAGDALANEIIDRTADYLATGIAILMHAVDPGAVILGGAMNFGGEENPLGHHFIERVRARVRELVFPVMAQRTVISFASLGGDAGFIGAAGIARATFKRRSPS